MDCKRCEPVEPLKASGFNIQGPWYASRGAFAIVPWDNGGSKLLIDWSGRLSVTGRAQDADPLGKRDKFGQGSDLHFLHHPVAVGFNGALGPA
jgi:hypothetical protein